ncbi:hypothetical protein HMPREF1981_00806, partial [Bacteroides pyogenes F0041]
SKPAVFFSKHWRLFSIDGLRKLSFYLPTTYIFPKKRRKEFLSSIRLKDENGRLRETKKENLLRSPHMSAKKRRDSPGFATRRCGKRIFKNFMYQ